MELEQAVFSYLSGIAALTAIVGTRIYPGSYKSAGLDTPALMYETVSYVPLQTMGTSPLLCQELVQFTCLGTDFAEARAIQRQVERAWNDMHVTTLGGGLPVQAAWIDDTRYLYTPPESHTNAIVIDVVIWYERSV